MEAVALIKRICIRPLVPTLPGPEGWVALRERERLVNELTLRTNRPLSILT